MKRTKLFLCLALTASLGAMACGDSDTDPKEQTGGQTNTNMTSKVPTGVPKASTLLGPDGATWVLPAKVQGVERVISGRDAQSELSLGQLSVSFGPQGARQSVPLEGRSVLDATQLQSGNWLLLSDQGLEILGDSGLTPTPLSVHVSGLKPAQVEVTKGLAGSGEEALWFKDESGALSLYWEGALHRIQGGGLGLIEGELVADGDGNIWARSPGAVHKLWLAKTAEQPWQVQVETSERQAQQLLRSAQGLWMVAGGILYKGEDQGWRPLEAAKEGPVEAGRANRFATDLWIKHTSGALSHWSGTEWSLVAGTTLWSKGGSVDALGRLWGKDAQGVAMTHDRRLRVQIEGIRAGESLTGPRQIQAVASFTPWLESVTIKAGGASLGTDATMMLDPSALQGEAHTLEVEAKWNTSPLLAKASLPFATENLDVRWAQVKPIFEASCKSCHDVTALYPLDTAALWQKEYENIYTWVSAGQMPPGNLPKLSQRQVRLIEKWKENNYQE